MPDGSPIFTCSVLYRNATVSDQSAQLTVALAGRYHIERELGRGGMATVYLAADLKHDRQVALKILHPELARGLGPERFLREIKLAARLSHPHILSLFDSGEADGLLYYVMPFVEGESLRTRLGHEHRLSVEEALSIGRAVAAALDYAHQHGVLHRDIKPDNIMIHQGEAMVTDFGIAKALARSGDETLTQAGLLVGTPSYMSPEQAAGETQLDGRSDVYSLGCVLYEMLAGRKPFQGPSALAILSKQVTEAPAPLHAARDDVPAAVEAVVLRAMAKDPDDRFATAAEFARALGDPRGIAPSSQTTAVTTPAPATTSIAVLPFLNLSADPENEYFADGMAEEIINALTKVEGLRVTARSSAFSFKGKGEAGGEIGRRLKVGAVLEGSVRRSGSRIRVTAELINVADGYHLWSERYDREMVDVFAIQDEISRSIVDTLKVKLLGPRDAPLVRRLTEDLEAYTTYLKGRYFWNRRTPEGLRKSITLFREAQARDPGYALAFAGEADAYNILGWWADLPPGVAFPAARSAAARAVALAPGLAEAHASQAFAKLYYDWDWAGAETDFERSLALNPKYPTARQWYAQHLITSGRSDEAAAQIRQSAELDPLSLIIQTTLSLISYYAGRYEESVADAVRTLDLDSNFGVTYRALGLAYLQLGRYEEAIASLRKAVSLSHFTTMLTANLAHAHARAGDRAAALAILAELRRASVDGYVSPYDLAWIHIGLDDRAAALDALEDACAERSSQMIFLRVDPVFQALRGDPRFRALLARVGAPSR
jgi:serine/threonine protein kinase/Flp pilus assembly protein TadD